MCFTSRQSRNISNHVTCSILTVDVRHIHNGLKFFLKEDSFFRAPPVSRKFYLSSYTSGFFEFWFLEKITFWCTELLAIGQNISKANYASILSAFRSFFGRFEETINYFRDLLTFRLCYSTLHCTKLCSNRVGTEMINLGALQSGSALSYRLSGGALQCTKLQAIWCCSAVH